MDIAERVVAGEVRAAARLMRDLDDGIPSARETLRQLFRHGSTAHVVGLTGSPGAGKSSLTDRLVHHYRQAGKTVGVVAVDPTSPFTGGAILGDRIRMQEHANDPGVFIRSMATRGNLGGLSRATADVVSVMEAMRKDLVIVETVGVGQDEIEIAKLAHTVVVVSVPGLGDDVQAIKAGVLEIADVFAVNKADRDGAERTVRDLRMMLEMRRQTSGRPHPAPADHDAAHHALPVAHATYAPQAASATVDGWEPPIVKTIALRDEGVAELAGAIASHLAHLDASGERKAREVARARAHFLALLREGLMQGALERLAAEEGRLDEIAARIAAREADPFALADELAGRLREPRA